MEFEADEAKNEANRLEHGFDFAFAVRIFDGAVRWFAAPRRWGEQRIAATGRVERRFITVVCTRGDERYRIISASPARSGQVD